MRTSVWATITATPRAASQPLPNRLLESICLIVGEAALDLERAGDRLAPRPVLFHVEVQRLSDERGEPLLSALGGEQRLGLARVGLPRRLWRSLQWPLVALVLAVGRGELGPAPVLNTRCAYHRDTGPRQAGAAASGSRQAHASKTGYPSSQPSTVHPWRRPGGLPWQEITSKTLCTSVLDSTSSS